MSKIVSSKKVLITGIDSFTGRHLEPYLKSKGFEVYGTVLERNSCENHFVCDIRKKNDILKIIKKTRADFIIHLAGISYVGNEDIRLLFDINLFGCVNLLDAVCEAKLIPKKIILPSSAVVYGNQHSEILDEEMCPNPINPYANSKNAMENAAKGYFKEFPVVITRPFNYIGKYQNENFVVPKIIKHYKEKKREIELGNIDVKREFNDIRFVVDAYYHLMIEPVHSQIVNICTSKGISLSQILEIMNRLSGYEIDVKVNPKFVRKNEIKSLVGSNKKLFEIIKNPKLYTLEETLREIFEE